MLKVCCWLVTLNLTSLDTTVLILYLHLYLRLVAPLLLVSYVFLICLYHRPMNTRSTRWHKDDVAVQISWCQFMRHSRHACWQTRVERNVAWWCMKYKLSNNARILKVCCWLITVSWTSLITVLDVIVKVKSFIRLMQFLRYKQNLPYFAAGIGVIGLHRVWR